MSFSPEEADRMSSRDSWFIRAGLFIFDRHQLPCFLVVFTILLVFYFLYALPLADDSMEHFLRTVTILLAGPLGGAALWELDKAMKALFTLCSRSHTMQGEGRVALPPYAGHHEQFPKPTIRNYSAAFGAGITGLMLQYAAQKRALKAAVDMPHKEFLEEFDGFESAIRSGRRARAYSHLLAIVSPHAYPRAKYVICELYSPILGDRVLWLEAKFVFRAPEPDELLELSVDCLMAGDATGVVRNLMRLTRAGTLSLTQRILTGMLLDRAIEHRQKVKEDWRRFRQSVWDTVIDSILMDNVTASTVGGEKAYPVRTEFEEVVMTCTEGPSKDRFVREIHGAWSTPCPVGGGRSGRAPVPIMLLERNGIWYYLAGHPASSCHPTSQMEY